MELTHGNLVDTPRDTILSQQPKLRRVRARAETFRVHNCSLSDLSISITYAGYYPRAHLDVAVFCAYVYIYAV